MQWLEKFVDPDYAYHATIARIWALLALSVADEPLVPFDVRAYAREVNDYVTRLKSDIEALPQEQDTVDLSKLEKAAEGFTGYANDFMAWEDNWTYRLMGIPEYNPMLEPRVLVIERMSRNNRMSNLDTHLLDLPGPEEGREGGLPGRRQFKHVIYGPQLWSGYDEAYFPGIRDALFEYKNVTAAQEQVDIVAKVLQHASWKLVN